MSDVKHTDKRAETRSCVSERTETHGDLISRKAAIDAVNSAFDRETLLNGFVRSIAVRAIRDLPTIEPERHGRWIHPYEYGLALPEHKCSVCGEWEYADSESNYCPNCGAEMKGEEE